MKNFITIFPLDKSVPIKQRVKINCNSPFILNKRDTFDLDIERLKQKKPKRKEKFSLSPNDKLSALNELIRSAESIKTKELRKFISITERDLNNKVKTLKKITHLDSEEYREMQAQRLRDRRFIKVDEREIRMLIKKDTLRHNFVLK